MIRILPKGTRLSCLFGLALVSCMANKGDNASPVAPKEIPSGLAEGSAVGDTAIMMKDVGIDFPTLLDRSLAGNPNAVRLLFWSSANVGLDGAGADGFGAYLIATGEKLGDEKILRAITGLEPDTLKTIRFFLLDDLGAHAAGQDSQEKAVTRLRTRFPQTWKYLNRVHDPLGTSSTEAADRSLVPGMQEKDSHRKG